MRLAQEHLLSHETLEPLIFSIRGRRVMLDADLARLYGVGTKVLNQAVKRNADRFPEDFGFQLASGELADLRSQTVTSSSQHADSAEEKRNGSRFATSSHGGRRHRSRVFTEHGALMAANVLRSDQAVHMSAFVIRAFVRLREHVAANAAILKRLAEIDRTLLRHDSALRDVYSKLLPLLRPPAPGPKRRIGFIVDDD
jgi:hypothetical protein